LFCLRPPVIARFAMAFYHVPGQKWIDRYLAIESQARIGLVTKDT